MPRSRLCSSSYSWLPMAAPPVPLGRTANRPAGAGALNERLQEALTPARPGLPERRSGGRVFRVGDKVTQIRNNYDKQCSTVQSGS